MSKRKDRIYLAGPDVFIREASRIREVKGDICARYDFDPVFPVDSKGLIASEIFEADCLLMSRKDVPFGLFNLSPFRGPSADPGTVFELGYMYALGKQVFGYTNSTLDYRFRIKDVTQRDDRKLWDVDGYEIENHGLTDNLMIECAILASGAIIERKKPASEVDPLAAVEAFDACVRALRSRIS
jgi:nucleoside 2-deoxyribosyltransferase